MATNNRNDGSVQKSSKPKSHPLSLIRLLQMIFIVPYISILYPFKLRFSDAAYSSQFCPVQEKCWVKTSSVKVCGHLRQPDRVTLSLGAAEFWPPLYHQMLSFFTEPAEQATHAHTCVALAVLTRCLHIKYNHRCLLYLVIY